MKLLFGANLAPRLARLLEHVYPNSIHVTGGPGLAADDFVIWEFARTNAYAIVSKDSDFLDLSSVRGAPPKVIFLELGNCSTSMVEIRLRAIQADIAAFLEDETAAFLIVHARDFFAIDPGE